MSDLVFAANKSGTLAKAFTSDFTYAGRKERVIVSKKGLTHETFCVNSYKEFHHEDFTTDQLVAIVEQMVKLGFFSGDQLVRLEEALERR
jgi:hypothetical protein